MEEEWRIYLKEKAPELYQVMLESLEHDLRWRDEEIERLKNWVNDLQAGMYINCVYCGHRLRASLEVCKHHLVGMIQLLFV